MKVLTLNLAHARGNALHQWLARRSRIEHNLQRVAELLVRERPDVVALQEADGPSMWSGRFDHVEYLARLAGFPHYVRGDHVRGPRGRYGTAMLAKMPIAESVSIRFPPSLPTPRKGLVLGRSCWPGRPDVLFDVVAVHLDFLRPAVRRRQVRHIIEHLSDREHPVIVMGDFNCDWCGRDGALRLLAEELKLTPCRPTERHLVTFPRFGRRLDWILVSSQFEFAQYHSLPDRVSDHYAVVAELRQVSDCRWASA